MGLAMGAPAGAQTINTGAGGTPPWMGPFWSNQIQTYQTFGQTFLAPTSGSSTLQSIDFGLKGPSGGMSYLAAVYAWTGATTTGSALSTSVVSTLPGSINNNTFTRIQLNMSGSALTPGTQYVVILTTLGTAGPPSGQYMLSTVNFSSYIDGSLVVGLDRASEVGTQYIDQPTADFDMLLMFSVPGPSAPSAPSVSSAPPGPDVVNTLFALLANSGAVRSVLSQRAAATTFALDYDCSVFDVHGFCVSAGFRNSQIGSDYADSGETAGLLTAAYRVTPEFRIGGFIDQNLVSQSPVGVDPKNTQPMLGAFAVYQENQDFSGLTIRGAVAYQEGDLRITRPELPNTEAGTGRTRTSALAFGGEIAYGVALDGTWVAQPYAGLRRSDSQRQGYVESDAVDFPVTYNRFGQQVNSATAGLRLRGAITPEFSLTFGAGMEHDLDSKMDRYSGTITGLAGFSINASQQQNETRAVGSAGMRYMVASNQAIAFDASVRQMPYGNDPSVTTMLRYSIGF
jgi:hypothetical protein